MTEQQLLDASEAQFMCPEHLEFFRDRLLQMREELLARMELQVPAGAEMMAASDPCDQATMEEERTAILQARARDRARLQEIRAALKRIEYGDFGYCEATGEPIGMRRLLAYPTARCSLEAQQRQEHSLRFARAT